MDPNVKKCCFDEISHNIFDAGKKVNINEISTDFGGLLIDSSNILEEWIKTHPEKELQKQFIVRGVTYDGEIFVTIAPESKLEKMKKQCRNYKEMLFSVEVPSKSRILNFPKLSEPTNIKLNLMCEERPAITESINIEPSTSGFSPKKETKNIRNSFESSKMNTTKPKTVASMFANSKQKPVDEKKEKSPEKSTSPKKSPNKKNNTKVGKTIANFFGKTPIQPVKTNVAESLDEIKPVSEPETVENIKKIEATPQKEEKNGKRSFEKDIGSDDDIVPKSQDNKPTKKRKKEETHKKQVLKKGSRIMQICDSSSDEEIHEKENDKKQEKYSESKEICKKPIVESNLSPNPNHEIGRKRYKAKRKVIRTYEEEGFLRTKIEMEEYSASEDEVKVVQPTQPPAKKLRSETSPVDDASKPKKKKQSLKNGAAVGAKQGSITSFFARK